ILRLSLDVGCDTVLRRDLTLLLDPARVLDLPRQGAEPARPTNPPASATAPSPSTSAIVALPAANAASATSSSSAAGATSSGSGRPAAAARRDRPATSQPGAGAIRRSSPTATGPAKGDRPGRSARAAPQRQRDRLTISGSGPGQELTTGAPITPRLTLSTSMADRTGQPPLPEAVLAILRQKQARLRAAPGGEDIPSPEAELVVLQKRATELRAQLEAVMAQAQTMRPGAGSPDGAPASAPAATAEGPSSKSLVPPTPVSALPQPLESTPPWYDARVLLALALGLIIALLIVGLIQWLRREHADRQRANRWNRTPYVPTSGPQPAPEPAAPIGFNGDPAVTPSVFLGERERTPMRDSEAFMPFSGGLAAQDVGVTDLAQATEKASVFVTLGRPEQAIDVLRDHIDHEPKPSPMAWLMLLDLYRQSNRRTDFGDVADRFHQAFNAETPSWNPVPSQSPDSGIAFFPRLLRRIRTNWGKPESLAVIEDLLYDNRGGARVGFSLTAFRDLLLLAAILDKHLHTASGVPDTDRESGGVEAPLPPPHLARAWEAAGQDTPQPVPRVAPLMEPITLLELDMGPLSDSPERSALETGFPVIAEAIISRWGKPGMVEYIEKLISSTSDNRGPMLSGNTLAELIMLQDVASELAEPSW
ncbi:MAG: hypothetical protein ABI831_16740, partial [Betaproteobacteria bacterium]